MAHGKTLEMRKIKRPAPVHIVDHGAPVKGKRGLMKPRGLQPHVNSLRDVKRHAPLRRDVPFVAERSIPEMRPAYAEAPQRTSRRRAKGIARRRWVSDLRIIRGHFPLDAVAVMHCACGITSYLREGATSADWASWDEHTRDHDACQEA